MSTVTTPQPTAAARRKTLYFLTWRWHFYAGLFVVPFMLMLALTGLVMLFDDEIEQARYAEVLNVTPQAQVMPVSQQLAAVQKAYPEAQVTQFIPAHQPDLANRFLYCLAMVQPNLSRLARTALWFWAPLIVAKAGMNGRTAFTAPY